MQADTRKAITCKDTSKEQGIAEIEDVNSITMNIQEYAPNNPVKYNKNAQNLFIKCKV